MKFYLIFTSLIFFSFTNVISQKYMQIHQKDGSVVRICLSDISKLTFGSLDLNALVNNSNEIQKIFKLNSYPNPATDFINIEYEIASEEKLCLEIYNLSGILIKKMSLDNQSVGKHIYQYDMKDLSDGVYFFKLRQNNIILFNKVIKYN